MTETEILNNNFHKLLKDNNIEECKKIIEENPQILRTALHIEDDNPKNYFHDAASLVLQYKNKELYEYILNNHLKELQFNQDGEIINSQLIAEILISSNHEYLDIFLNHTNVKDIDWNNSINNSSPLIEAINFNFSYKVLSQLIKLGVSPIKSNPYSENAFTACAKNGDIDVYNIININEAINNPELDVDLVINRSIQYNNTPIFDVLFKKSSKSLDELFELAVEFKTTRILQAIILENSFLPGSEQLNELTEIITYTYETKEDCEAAVFLLDFLSTVKVKFEKFLNSDNKNIWNLAIDNNNIILVDKLLTIPEIINQKDLEGNTPLMYALERRMHKIADKILEHKPNVNIKNKHGDSALIFAAKNNMSYLVEPLIELNAFTYEKNKKNETPLYWSTNHQNFSMTAKLLWAGAPIATNSFTIQQKIMTGQIDLSGSVHMENKDMDESLLNNFKALVQLGFNLNALSEQGYTFPMHFVVNNHIRNFASILECYFDPNQQKDDGNSLLMEAIKQTNPLFVNLLVQRFGTEIDLALKNDLGQNAVDIAIESSNVNALWQILNKTDNVSQDMILKSIPLLLECQDYSIEQLMDLTSNIAISLDQIHTSTGEDMWFTAIRRKSIEDIKFLIVNFEEGPDFQYLNKENESIEDIINSTKDKDFKDDVLHILSPRKKLKNC